MTTNWQDPAASATPAAPSAGGGPNKKKRVAIVATLLVVIAGLATAAGLVMVNRGSDDTADSPQYVVVDAADTTPVFEPRDARGNDPFFPLEIQLTAYQEEVETEAAQAQADAGELVEPPTFDVAALDEAVKTGLYGGTEENTCDPERLISFLYAHPDIGEAWAKVQAIEFSEIADYIRSLDVRVLAEPVNVLNHGYDSGSGSAYEIDAVLDAGTAVLVDADGDVRARCYCGNPIKPKPPEHRPPRCLVFGSFVTTEPGGNNRRDGAPRDVVLTGNEANVTNGGTWVEVAWGDNDDQQGWVPAYALRKSYCPIPTSDRFCPGPGTTKVWHTPDATTPVGRVTGEVRTADTTFDMFAPISPVGGIGSETIINDFMLIRFTEAASAQNSAWVKLSDLNQDTGQCQRVRQCINTEGPVWDRAGGAPIAGADGVVWAEFTGHFSADPATHTEIRLSDGTGTYGWIGLFYTPLPDERCEQPILECVEYAEVYETSTQEAPDRLGRLINTTVEVIGGPQDGRMHIRFHNGPDGWVDQADFFDGYDSCEPSDKCMVANGPGYTTYPDQGDVLNPAIPSPKIVQDLGQSISVEPSLKILVGIDGTPHWIEFLDLAAADCDPPQVSCPESPYTSLLDDFTPTLRDPGTLDLATEMTSQMMVNEESGQPSSTCCVSQLFDSPDVGDPSASPTPASVVTFGSGEVDGIDWYLTIDSKYFQDIHILPDAECEVSVCPAPFDDAEIDDERVTELRDAIETDLLEEELSEEDLLEESPGGITLDIPDERLYGPRMDLPVSGDCCIDNLYSAINGINVVFGSAARWVDVASGPHDADPAWYMTTDGLWFPDTVVLEDSACRDVSCPVQNPAPGPGDLVSLDELAETLPVGTAAALFIKGNTSSCCVTGSLAIEPAGEPGLLIETTLSVTVVDIDDSGEWYEVWVEPAGSFWAHIDQFVSPGLCGTGDDDDADPAGCPAGSVVKEEPGDDGLQACCVAIDTAGATAYETRVFSGEPTDIGAGVFEYEARDGERYLSSDFADAALCESDVPVTPVPTTPVPVTPAPVTPVPVTPTPSPAPSTPVPECANGDEDTQCNRDDNCPEITNESQIDSDNDGSGDACDPCTDADQDLFCESPGDINDDNCWGQYNPDQSDADRDGDGDICDNCPAVSNADQADADSDGLGDACECPAGSGATAGNGDRDGDGVCDVDDNCVDTPNADQADRDDSDGYGDVCDNCPDVYNPGQADSFGQNGVGDACECPAPPGASGVSGNSDSDDVCDIDDNCDFTANPGQTDNDQDGFGDACDNCPNAVNTSQIDTDDDGFGDGCDFCPGANGPQDASNVANPDQGFLYDTNNDGVRDSCFPPIG